jgi:hypothetical protein
MNAQTISNRLTKLFDLSTKGAGDLAAGLDTLRSRIADLQGGIADVEHIAISKDQALKRLDSWARRARGAGIEQLPISDFTNFEGSGRLDFTPLTPIHHDVLVSVLADVMRDRLAARIEAFYSDQPSLADDAREKRLAGLEAELADLEIAEEKLIRTAEAAGLPVLRRDDASPLIVLAPDAALAS